MSSIALVEKVKENIGKVIVGKEEQTERLLLALVCGGHVLIEDVPGLGKTTLVTALARSLSCTYSRIQFTPDLLPSDVTGYTAFNPKTGEREVCFGGLMAQIVLADEINRTSPKTQSSLLEAMQETQLTIDGTTYPLPEPFIVLATQNPVEHTGTYPLPEAQLDRFLIRLTLGYPTDSESVDILTSYLNGSPKVVLEPVATGEDIVAIQEAVPGVRVSEPIRKYIVELVEATRKHDDVELGISTRGMLSLLRACQAYAAIHGRDYVLPDDVKALAEPVFAHRLILKVKYNSSAKASELVSRLLTSVPAPTESTTERL